MPRSRFSQMFAGARITRGALYLLFVTAGVSLLFLLSDDSIRAQLAHYLTATGDSVWRDFKVWQLVTSPIMEVEFVSLIFHGFMLWMFLPALERWWGTKRFLLFALWTSLAGTTVGTLVGLAVGAPAAISGLDPFIFGGIVAYGVLFASAPVQFFGVLPMTGKQLTIGMCAFVLLFVIIGQQWAEGAAWAAAMLLAFLLTWDKSSPKLWWLRLKQRRLRRHLKVVKDDDPPKRWVN
jgi:membrane associated rhomboid family serine protease